MPNCKTCYSERELHKDGMCQFCYTDWEEREEKYFIDGKIKGRKIKELFTKK